MGIVNALGLGMGKVKSAFDIPFKFDLLGNYSTRSGNTITDSLGNNAQLLPMCFKGNGATYFQSNQNQLSQDNFTLLLDIELTDVTGTQTFYSQGFTSLFQIIQGSNLWRFRLSDGTNVRDIDISFATLPLTNRKYTFKIVHSKTGSTTIFESDIQVGTRSGTFTNVTSNPFYIGCTYNNIIVSSTVKISKFILYSDTTMTSKYCHYTLIGSPEVEYDLSGNLRNLTVNGFNVSCIGYGNGDTYMLDNGYTLYEKTSSPNIYIPNPISATTPAGYTKVKTYNADLNGINFAPCLIGFNETSSGESALQIFDRSNTTIQSNASRSSIYYDSTNLATKSRYHITELITYDLFNSFFNTDYQDTVFIKINKTNSDFSIIQILNYTTKKISNSLSLVKSYCGINSKFTVGLTKNFSTINQAITRSYDDYTITIDEGTYNEYIDVSTKKINFIGSGNLGTYIYKDVGIATVLANSAILIGTNSTFTNIKFNSRQAGSTPKSLVKVTAGNPIFTNCQIGVWAAGVTSQNGCFPMEVSGTSIVTMNNCNVFTNNNTNTKGVEMLFTDSSQLTFTGTHLCALVRLQNAAHANIDCDYFYTNGANFDTFGLRLDGDSVCDLHINIKEVYINSSTLTEVSAGTYSSSGYRIHDASQFTLSGNQITGGTNVLGATSVVNFNDINSTLGHFWCVTNVGATNTGINTIININRCNIKLDMDSDSTGLHLLELVHSEQLNIIDSILEFTGHTGNWFTMGQCIQMSGKTYIKNSQIIDNVNDNIPFGENYIHTISCNGGDITIEDSEISNINWDGVGTNTNLRISKVTGKSIKVVLKNVIFNNSQINTSPIAIDSSELLEVGDYICEDNVTYNSSAFKLSVSAGDAVSIYNQLSSACPL